MLEELKPAWVLGSAPSNLLGEVSITSGRRACSGRDSTVATITSGSGIGAVLAASNLDMHVISVEPLRVFCLLGGSRNGPVDRKPPHPSSSAFQRAVNTLFAHHAVRVPLYIINWISDVSGLNLISNTYTIAATEHWANVRYLTLRLSSAPSSGWFPLTLLAKISPRSHLLSLNIHNAN